MPTEIAPATLHPRQTERYSDEETLDKKPHRFSDILEEEDPEKEPSLESPLSACPPWQKVSTAVPPLSLQTGGASLPQDIEALFQKMGSQLILLTTPDYTDTTFYLDSPQFSSSVFYGTKITIKEFSTAPKIFNIEIASSSFGKERLDLHKTALLNAFDKNTFNFSIQRLDTFLHEEETPLFHRKEGVAQDEEDPTP